MRNIKDVGSLIKGLPVRDGSSFDSFVFRACFLSSGKEGLFMKFFMELLSSLTVYLPSKQSGINLDNHAEWTSELHHCSSAESAGFPY